MSGTQIENISYPYNRKLARIKVNVSYDSDIEKVKRVLIDIAGSTKHVLKILRR